MDSVIVFFVVILLVIICTKVIKGVTSFIADMFAQILKGAVALAILFGLLALAFPAILENIKIPSTQNSSYGELLDTSRNDTDATRYYDEYEDDYIVDTEDDYIDFSNN